MDDDVQNGGEGVDECVREYALMLFYSTTATTYKGDTPKTIPTELVLGVIILTGKACQTGISTQFVMNPLS